MADTYPFTSDSYVSVVDAAAYFATRLNTGVWDNASASDRVAALCEATRAIDRLQFKGVTTDRYNQSVNGLAATGQVHAFPRNGDTVIPEGIRIATCECAFAFLDGVDTDSEIADLGVESQGFASVRQSRRPSIVELSTRSGIPSAKAWMYLVPFLSDPREAHLRRI